MSKLDDILRDLENDVEHDIKLRLQHHRSGKSPKSIHRDRKQQVKDLMIEMIKLYGGKGNDGLLEKVEAL